MTVKDALRGSNLPSADAEVLLSHVLGKNRAWLLAHGDDELKRDHWEQFMGFVDRRRKHEPVAYVTGVQEFYGRPFTVDRRVLIPRPATEGVVRRALQFLNDGQDAMDDVDEGIMVTAKKLKVNSEKLKITTIVDVGTGSGCIAITLALELPTMKIIATDISPDALDVAKMNAKHHGVLDRITFKEGSGLQPVMDLKENFLLVSNPPYIPSGNDLMPDVKDFEPHIALFGGKNGNMIVDELIAQAEMHPMCVGWVIECQKKETKFQDPKAK